MNCKFTFGSAATIAAVVAGATVAVSPAQALSLGDSLDFAGESRLEIGSGSAILNFDSNALFGPTDYSQATGKAVVGGGSSAAFGNGGSSVNLVDLYLVADGADKFKLGAAVKDFLTIASAPGTVKFTLTSFSLSRASGNRWFADFAGQFTSPDPVFGEGGDFSTQGRFTTSGATYSAFLTAGAKVVPTPALLPGLIGLGLGVLRKRKAEAAQEAEAEA